MAQFVHQYVAEMLKRESALAHDFPTVVPSDIMTADRQMYTMNLMNLLISGTIMKVISTIAPTVTDAVWIDALNHSIDSSQALPWPTWILEQTQPPA